ncbi:MAG: ABC-F family ATP-binding cassette domain-containing protein [Bryobacter sp.]|jgi:ATP-binding cassette subfamily F protein 3|nr:ABC-F family ATP-binding cassette domain-containing protein [Bryobacter sp. CoA8 C33]
MIQLTKAAKRFGPKVLFEDVNWLIGPRDRIGLVGANGTGKSTLMKILAGLEQLDGGEIVRMKSMRLGYLPQDGLRMAGRSVFAECISVFEPLRQIERDMEAALASMSELDPAGEAYAQAAERFSRLDAEFRAKEGYTIEMQVGTILTGLGFSKDDWNKPCEEFSGGWQMRIALAKLLLEKPEALLLDEPTNHLDLEARNWLEQYLLDYPNAFILISHDRYFLDVTVAKIVEVWNRKVTVFSGNYTHYQRQKEERLEQMRAAQRNQLERVAQIEAFVDRFRAKATKAKQAQSRLKELDKIEVIEIPEEEPIIHFRFPTPKPSGRVVAEFRDVAKSYGSKRVFEHVNLTIERGDRIALVGHNGAGKSTLIKLLTGLEGLSAGEYKLGHNVEFDYFAQDQYKALDPEAEILDDLCAAAPRATATELRGLLGCFLFREDDVFKKIGVLSGGERNRYALCKLLTQPSNFVLLDEPTNHLDMRAKEVLLEALKGYEGTVVFVSHDRYFIDQLATKVFEVAGGTVTAYPGNYEEFLRAKARQQEPEAAAPVAAVKAPAAEDKTAACRRMNPMKQQQLEKRLGELEADIARREATVAELEAQLSNYRSAEESQRLATAAATERESIDQLMREWEEVSEQLN